MNWTWLYSRYHPSMYLVWSRETRKISVGMNQNWVLLIAKLYQLILFALQIWVTWKTWCIVSAPHRMKMKVKGYGLQLYMDAERLVCPPGIESAAFLIIRRRVKPFIHWKLHNILSPWNPGYVCYFEKKQFLSLKFHIKSI